jgi:DNA replication protein DnaC
LRLPWIDHLTSNLPFEEWTSVFRSQRLTGALLDRLTHNVHILELNGESRRREVRSADPETGEIISASSRPRPPRL